MNEKYERFYIVMTGFAGAFGTSLIAEKTEDGLNYSDLNDRNIGRIDELGEFLNRPLFIMKSKSFRD